MFNMGYGTNATTIPSLMGKGSLIISDSLNHTSIVNGVRAAGSSVKVFKHDDPVHLEQVLRKAIVEGQPGRTAHGVKFWSSARACTPWRVRSRT